MSLLYISITSTHSTFSGLIHRLPSLFGKEDGGDNAINLKDSWLLKYLHAGTMPLLGLIDALILASGNSHVRERLFRCLCCQSSVRNKKDTRWRRNSATAMEENMLDEIHGEDDDGEESDANELAYLRNGWSDEDDFEYDNEMGMLDIDGGGVDGSDLLQRRNSGNNQNQNHLSSSLRSTDYHGFDPNVQPMRPGGGGGKVQGGREQEVYDCESEGEEEPLGF